MFEMRMPEDDAVATGCSPLHAAGVRFNSRGQRPRIITISVHTEGVKLNPTLFRVDFSVWHAFPVALPPAIKFVRFANGTQRPNLIPNSSRNTAAYSSWSRRVRSVRSPSSEVSMRRKSLSEIRPPASVAREQMRFCVKWDCGEV